MSRYTKTQVTQLSANEQAAIDNINKNFNDIESAIQDTVSRSGNTPTHMTHDLDMNGKRIINVPAPLTDTDLVRRQDVVGDIALVQNLVNATTNAAAQTLQAAAEVQEIMQEENVGLVADDLALDENSKIRICGNNIDKITSTANNISNVNAVADNEANINAVNANKTNINKVANDINRVNLVADDISSVHTVAIDISTVIDVADNKTNIDAVAGNETNINTCVSNMAAITSASTQASNAANSATAAAASAQQAAISAAGSKFKLFHHDWFDYQLNDLAWLRADTFSWQDGTVYFDAYDHLVSDVGYVRYMIPDDGFNIKFYRAPAEDTEMYAWTNSFSTLYTESEFPENGDNFYYHGQIYGTVLSAGTEAGSDVVTPTTETIGSYTITYYPATDGHKIVLADQETTVSNIYNESGVAWYYILDTVNIRFKLPRTKFGFTGLRDTVGKYVAPGLPNHNHSYTNVARHGYNGITATEAYFSNGDSAQGNVTLTTTNASDSNSIYGNSITVQPPATQMYLYFYVGQYNQSATEQTAGLNSELFNGKLDLDLGNATTAAKETIVGWGMPDYDSGVSIGEPSTYQTIPVNSFVRWSVNAAGSTREVGIYVSNADESVEIKFTMTTNYYSNLGVPVPAGYKVKSFLGGETITYYPLKGVSNA